MVGASVLEELLGGVVVEVEAFGLSVGCVRSADVGAFVPVESEPTEGVEDEGFGAVDGAGLVGVFDADDELTAASSCEEPVEEGGADVADVGFAGG